MRLCKTVLVCITMSAVSTFAAAAEGLAITPAFSWTGFYAGVQAGYGTGNSRPAIFHETSNGNRYFDAEFGSIAPQGFLGGLQAGYNQQYRKFVVGIEADFALANINGSASGTRMPYPYYTPALANQSITVSTQSQVDWLATIRPRIGYAGDDYLAFVTAGLALGKVKYQQSMSDTYDYTGTSSSNDTRVGYVVGFGFEKVIQPNLTVKIEYQYVDLGSKSTSPSRETGDKKGFMISTENRIDLHTLRVGINRKF